MTDETIVLYEACNSLSEDRKVQKKLQTDYPYYCKKNGLFYGDGDAKGNFAKIVKAAEFYPWVRENLDKKTPLLVSRENIPEEYRYRTCDIEIAYMCFAISVIDTAPTIDSQDFVAITQKNWDLEDKIKELEDKLAKSEEKRAKAEEKAQKWDDWNKNKGRRKT